MKEYCQVDLNCILYEPQNLLRYRDGMFKKTFQEYCKELEKYDWCERTNDCSICLNLEECFDYYNRVVCGFKPGGKYKKK